jgi:polyhydroxyalkanoate synthesis repressor PhaR
MAKKLIKKYSNRRLYDTDASKYITLDELAEIVRKGADVKVVDASEGGDLTQATLAQIVVESRGAAKLLPVPLLVQMIRMEDKALTEFLTLYMSWALDMYNRASGAAKPGESLGSDMIHRYMAMATLPFDITRQGLGLIKSAVGRRDEGSDVDALRDELAELKSMIKDMKKDSM